MSRGKPKKKSTPVIEDPHAEREASQYENPIPSREFIMQQLAEAEGPMSFRQLCKVLNLDKEQEDALQRRLRAMEREGQAVRTRRGGYGLPKKMDLIAGRVIAHPDGYGFLVPDSGGDDLFLSEKQMRALMHGDRALVSVAGVDRRGRREGALVEVLERNTTEIVGRLFVGRGYAWVEPSHKRMPQNVLVATDGLNGAEDGQIVVVRVVEPPSKHQPALGKVSEVLGEHMGPGMEIEIAVRDYELPHVWPEDVLQEIGPLKRRKSIPKKMLEGRTDFRDLPLVTIDGEDARDFDDAVYCEPRGKGWRLLVAIADVSAYVTPGSALDREAHRRGNSVYFPDRVIPMLPEVLSNQWCSLNPEVDRLCMVCEMFISHHGGLRKTQFHQGVMRSAARLTYTRVSAALEDGDRAAVPESVLPHLQNLHALYQLLRKRREKRGAIDFETTETRILFGENRKIENIVPTRRNEAHKLIEEMMLAANLATAQWLEQQQMPFLYRIHEGPDAEKLAKLRDFLKELGLRLYGGDEPQAIHYARLLNQIQERPDSHMIQTVLLRSLRMAIYTPENKGHFGLAYDTYTHFTSPIRRYPDLLVHRALRHRLLEKPPENFNYSFSDLQSLGEQCSMTERRADDATRDAVAWLKCEYMRDKVGEVYEGIITAVTSFGLFVELDGIFVEGLVHVSALRNDYYHFDPIGHRLHGERAGKVYRLADKLKVRVVRVSLDDRKIDFTLADEEGEEEAARPEKEKKGDTGRSRNRRRSSRKNNA